MSPRRFSSETIYYILSGVFAVARPIMYTTYTVYFVQAAGLDPLQLVLVGTVLELTYFLFEVPTGVVADSVSRRLSVILGFLLLGAAALLTGAVPTFTAILLAQVISGVGYTFLSGATTAWLADEAGEGEVARILLRSSQLERLSSLAGIVIGAALASLWLNLTYLAGGALLLLLGVFLILAMPEHGFQPRPAEERNTWAVMGRTLRAGVRAVRASPILLTLIVAEFFAGAASEGFDRLGQAHLLANFAFPAWGGLTPIAWFGVLGVAGTLAGLVVVEPLRRRLERASRDPAGTVRALLALEGLVIISTLTFALTGNFWLAVVALLARDVAGALGAPLFDAWLVQTTRSEVRATVISMVGQSNALGQIGGGPGVGLLGRRSLRAALAASGLLLAPVLALYARALRGGALTPAEPDSERPALEAPDAA